MQIGNIVWLNSSNNLYSRPTSTILGYFQLSPRRRPYFPVPLQSSGHVDCVECQQINSNSLIGRLRVSSDSIAASRADVDTLLDQARACGPLFCDGDTCARVVSRATPRPTLPFAPFWLPHRRHNAHHPSFWRLRLGHFCKHICTSLSSASLPFARFSSRSCG